MTQIQEGPACQTGPTETPATKLAVGCDRSGPAAGTVAALADAAVTLAAAGLAVFPIRPHGKTPYGACRNCRTAPRHGPDTCGCGGCHGLLDASADPGLTAARWQHRPGSNVGVATGPSGLAVVDLDGPDGVAQWRDLVAVHGAERTLTVSTPSGGFHLWYRAREERPLRSTAGQLAESIDSRGVGGYVVAPPSTRADGAYRWRDITDVASLPPVPAWVLDALDRTRAASRPAVTPAGGGTVSCLPPGNRLTVRHVGYARAAVRGEIDRVLSARPGTRNVTLNRAAFALGQFVGVGLLDRVAVVTALRQAAEQIGLGERESDRSITSGINAGVRQPRTGISR